MGIDEGDLYNGRRFRVLTVVDNFSRECPVLEVDHSLTGQPITLLQGSGWPEYLIELHLSADFLKL